MPNTGCFGVRSVSLLVHLSFSSLVLCSSHKGQFHFEGFVNIIRREKKLTFIILKYSTTLLPSVNTIALGMFCGAKYTNYTFMPFIKHH